MVQKSSDCTVRERRDVSNNGIYQMCETKLGHCLFLLSNIVIIEILYHIFKNLAFYSEIFYMGVCVE